MNYDEFKNELARQITDYLPKEYKSWTCSVQKVNKVNGAVDALMLNSQEKTCVVPAIYLNKYYQQYLSGTSMKEVITSAANEFLGGREYVKNTTEAYGLKNPKENIIYVLVNTDKNQHLLAQVPHRQIMDLSMIYRVIADIEDEGFNSAVVTNQMAEAFKMDEEALYRTAAENTPRIMPVKIAEIGELFYIIGNSRGALGAAAVLYEGVLENMAEILGKDLYIIPSSIHEVYIMPQGQVPAQVVKNAILDANRTVVREEDVLSDNLYCYSRSEGRLTVAG